MWEQGLSSRQASLMSIERSEIFQAFEPERSFLIENLDRVWNYILDGTLLAACVEFVRARSSKTKVKWDEVIDD